MSHIQADGYMPLGYRRVARGASSGFPKLAGPTKRFAVLPSPIGRATSYCTLSFLPRRWFFGAPPTTQTALFGMATLEEIRSLVKDQKYEFVASAKSGFASMNAGCMPGWLRSCVQSLRA